MNTEQLQSLLDRVREAEGADRAIDASLFVLGEPSYASTGPMPGWIKEQEAGRDDFKVIPRVTASIDAALALTERVLPGWCYKLVQESGTYTFVVRDAPELAKVAASAVASKPTAPLAILCAVLTALYMRHQTDEAGRIK